MAGRVVDAVAEVIGGAVVGVGAVVGAGVGVGAVVGAGVGVGAVVGAGVGVGVPDATGVLDRTTVLRAVGRDPGAFERASCDTTG